MISPGQTETAKETTFWPNWPRQRFVCLGNFNFDNRSALEVAALFTDGLCAVAQDVSGSTFTQLDFTSFKSEELKRWSIALINELYHRSSTNWPTKVTQEDFDRMHQQVGDELGQAESAVTKRATTTPPLPPSRFKPTGKSITVATVCRLLKGMKSSDGKKIPCSRRTVDAWKQQWSIVKTTNKTIYYSWDDTRNHIDLMFQHDIQEPGDKRQFKAGYGKTPRPICIYSYFERSDDSYPFLSLKV